MDKSRAARDKLLNARGELRAAHADAGIATAIEELSRNTYSASQFAEGQRRVVFGIPDLTARKRVMQGYRACQKAAALSGHAEIDELRSVIAEGGRGARNGALVFDIVVGLMFVFGGSSMFGVTGAIAGCMVAVLFGVAHLRNAEIDAAARIASARSDLKEQLNDSGFPSAMFSEEEADSGTPRVAPSTGGSL